MALRAGKTTTSDDYNREVRIAHDQATQRVRLLRAELEAKYQLMLDEELTYRKVEIYREVGKVIQEEIAKGEKKYRIRAGLRTNSTHVWDRYMQYVSTEDQNPARAEKDATPSEYVLESADGLVRWNFTTQKTHAKLDMVGRPGTQWKERNFNMFLPGKPGENSVAVVSDGLPPRIREAGYALTEEQRQQALDAGFSWDNI